MSAERLQGEGLRLARMLPHRDDPPVVLAIPRSGLHVADALARELRAPLDVLVATKVTAGPARRVIGAIAEGGGEVVDEAVLLALGVSVRSAQALFDQERARLDGHVQQMRGAWPLPVLAGRTVILVDDAVLSGMTMQAAIDAVAAHGARWIIVATPLIVAGRQDRLARAQDLVFLRALPEAQALRDHAADRENGASMTDAEVHELIVHELQDVGADPFHGLAIDGV